jgi:hypothetical protein
MAGSTCGSWRRTWKIRHLRRDPRATAVVAESEPPFRGVEVRGDARFIHDGVPQTARRIAARYIGEERGTAYVASLPGDHVIYVCNPAPSGLGLRRREYD